MGKKCPEDRAGSVRLYQAHMMANMTYCCSRLTVMMSTKTCLVTVGTVISLYLRRI